MNKQRLTWKKISLELLRPFRIAYGVATIRDTHWIQLEDDSGWGEGVIPSYHQISNAELYACWHKASISEVPFPVSIHQVQGWIGDDCPGPARCALELALLDRIGRIENKPLYQLLDLPNPKKLVTSYTISISTPQEMAAEARAFKKYPILKIKLGNEEDEACIAAIREVRQDATLRVDVNGAWDLSTAKMMVRRLAIYNLDLIEQPLPRGQVTELGILQSGTNIPIVADESVQTIDDIHALGLAGVAGINLKLMKVGGVLTALEMIRVAQEYNMRIMLGCMIETSIGVTAMAHLSGLADWIDLDAPLLIKNDPFEGLTYDKHLKISVPASAGIGVKNRVTE
jgi:L-alanine-DL-glutamate epimerase-like enolase superfamily enzyme